MSAERRRGRIAKAIISGTILLDFMGFAILIPVLPLYAKELGASAGEVGLMLAMYALAVVLFLPLWGWISDRIGRRPVLLVCLFGTAVSFAWLALADSLVMIYASRALGGFFGASIGTAQAYMTDLTDSEDRTHGMGLIGAAFGMGFVLGNLLGGTLANFAPSLPFYATSALALLNLVLAVLYLPESRPASPTTVGWESLKRVLVPTPFLVMASVHNNQTRLYLYLFFHIFLAFSAIEAMFPLFTQNRFEWNELQTGLYLAYFGVLLGVVQVALVGPLAKRFGEVPLVIVGLALTGVCVWGVGLAHSVTALMLLAVGVAFGNGLGFPALTSLFSKVCGEEEAGEYMSQSQAMAHTGRAVGPLLWGWVFDRYGVGWPFVLAGIGMLGALAIFIAGAKILLRRHDA